jgi:hypothetical protein
VLNANRQPNPFLTQITKEHRSQPPTLWNKHSGQPCEPEAFINLEGIIDLHVFLKNTHGHNVWAELERRSIRNKLGLI